MRTQWLAGGLLGAAFVVGIASCGEQSPTALDPSAGAISLQIVSGNGQSGTAGAELPAPIVVRVMDEHQRHPVRDMPVNFVITQGGGTFYAGTGISDEHGYASDYWTLGTTAGAQQAEARAVTGRSGERHVFGVFLATAVAGPPAKLAFSVPPAGAVAGVALSPAVQVLVLDAHDNVVTGVATDVTLALTSGTGTPGAVLGGTLTKATVNGIATFDDLTMDKAGTGYTLTATTTGLAGTTSSAFAVSAGAPARLAFAVQPSAATAGAAINPAVQVLVLDAAGNPATGATTSITMALTGTGPSGAVLGGTVTKAATNGVATFGDLTVDKAGAGYTLMAAAGSLTSATSDGFLVSPGPATHLAFTVQPNTVVAGVALGPALEVTVRDAFGNTVPDTPVRDGFGNIVPNATLQVTLALTSGTGPSGAVLGGTLTRPAVNGVAAFGDLTIDKMGAGYSLTAAAGGLSSATSSGFVVTPGPAARLAFTVQPAVFIARTPSESAVEVAVQDGFGNTATGATAEVTVALASGTGTLGAVLSGTLTASAVNGVATFSDLTVDRGGSGYILVATSPGLTNATSAGFAVTVGFVLASMNGGLAHTCGLTPAGLAYCWGNNAFGQLGDGTYVTRLTPVPVAGGLTFASLSTTQDYTCGLTPTGVAYCWGYNGGGQLGDGTGLNRPNPVPVAGGLTFDSLTAGLSHTCGLAPTGEAYCWGSNSYGELGDGTTGNRLTPVAVAGGVTFASLTAGDFHTCGLTATGVAYCWGSDGYGQLETAGADPRLPVPVAGGLTFASLSTGSYHSCGLTIDGRAFCWGWNAYGEVGVAGAANIHTPVPVAGAFTFANLSAGGQHTCSLTSAGQAYCWGSNSYGELGDGTRVGRWTPVPVQGPTFAGLRAGVYHTCALDLASVAFCWGNNSAGQLGDGSTSGRPIPRQVVAP